MTRPKLDLLPTPTDTLPPPDFTLFDAAVEYLRGRKPGVRALQIGANDGILYDPLYPHILNGLPALLVEPHPEYVAALTHLHRERPHVTVANVAITGTVGTAPLYYVRNEAITNGLVPARAQGFASFDRQALTRPTHNIPGIERHIASVVVPTTTYGNLIKKHNASPSIVVIDVEGNDDDIVHTILDTADHPLPDMLFYEHEHVPLGRRLACETALTCTGYTITHLKNDTLAFREQ